MARLVIRTLVSSVRFGRPMANSLLGLTNRVSRLSLPCHCMPCPINARGLPWNHHKQVSAQRSLGYAGLTGVSTTLEWGPRSQKQWNVPRGGPPAGARYYPPCLEGLRQCGTSRYSSAAESELHIRFLWDYKQLQLLIMYCLGCWAVIREWIPVCLLPAERPLLFLRSPTECVRIVILVCPTTPDPVRVHNHYMCPYVATE